MKKMAIITLEIFTQLLVEYKGGCLLDYDFEVVEEVVAISLQIVYIIYNEWE